MIHISIHTTTTLDGWSAGYCGHCHQTEPVRIETVIRRYVVMFVPSTHRYPPTRRCDFCRREVDSILTDDLLPPSSWHPRHGPAVLMRLLELPETIELPDNTKEPALHSLLSAVDEIRVGFDQNSILTGFLGAIVGILLWVAAFQAVQEQLPNHRAVGIILLLSILMCIALGAYAGMRIYSHFAACARASQLLAETCANYGLNVDLIERLSQTYDSRVCAAVKNLRTAALREKFNFH